MDLPKRKDNRLKKYDYSTDGAYFVTICTKDKKHNLSKIHIVTEEHETRVGADYIEKMDYIDENPENGRKMNILINRNTNTVFWR